VRIEDGVAFRLHRKEGIVHQSNSQRGLDATTGRVGKTEHGHQVLHRYRESEHGGCGSGYEWQSPAISMEVAESYGPNSRYVWNRSRWAGLIAKLKEVSQLLPELKFTHVRREVNHVAHDLAQLALRNQQCKVTGFNVPPG
jgi:hypothetical protein